MCRPDDSKLGRGLSVGTVAWGFPDLRWDRLKVKWCVIYIARVVCGGGSQPHSYGPVWERNLAYLSKTGSPYYALSTTIRRHRPVSSRFEISD